MGSAVCSNPADKVLNWTSPDAAREGLYYVWSMRIEPKTFLSCRAKEVESSLLIHIVLINELGWPLNWQTISSVIVLIVLLLLRYFGSLVSKTKYLMGWNFNLGIRVIPILFNRSRVEFAWLLCSKECWLVFWSTGCMLALIWNGV